MGKAGSKFQIIHEMILRKDNVLTVSELCRVAGVSRSGYYRWINAEEYRKAIEARDQADFNLILQAYNFRGYKKGFRSIHMRLLHREQPVLMNTKKIRRLMNKYGLVCPIRKGNPYRQMAKALKTNHTAENLLNREFAAHGPRKVLLTDITYIPYDGDFCYLSTILDAYTRQVLAYVLSDSLGVDFVLESIEQLVDKHGIALSAQTLIHSDQGFHYTSRKFIQIVKDNELRQSMSRRGNCWDNAPQESFFGHMKDEIDLSQCLTFEQVKVVIDDWMDYYNNDRYVWELAKLSPNEYYTYITTGIYPLTKTKTPC